MTAALKYNATLSANSAAATNEPMSWTINIRRPQTVPAGLTLNLVCAFNPGNGAGPSDDSDASYLNLPETAKSKAVMGPGSSSASCTGEAVYRSAGNYTSKVQVFVESAPSAYGLLGVNTPAVSSYLTVSAMRDAVHESPYNKNCHVRVLVRRLFYDRHLHVPTACVPYIPSQVLKCNTWPPVLHLPYRAAGGRRRQLHRGHVRVPGPAGGL